MYRPKTTIEQWRILQAVVDFGGYAQAGEALNKSQSSLNHAVAKLQSTLGVQLLKVKGRKAYLTEAGKVMLRQSRVLTQSIEDMEQLADNIHSGWEPEITIATEILYSKNKLYNALDEFQPLSRGTRIRVQDEVLTGAIDRITNKTADLVFCPTTILKGTTYQELGSVSLICCGGVQHPFANRDVVTLNELEQELQLVISDTSLNPKDGVTAWLKSEQRWTFSNFYQAIDVLRRGRGYCWLPEHLAKPYIENNELKVLPLESYEKRSVHMGLVIPAPSKIGPATRLLKKLILEQYK